MGKPRGPQALALSAADWHCSTDFALQALQAGRELDFLLAVIESLKLGGALASSTVELRLSALRTLEQHCVALCQSAPEALLRQLYEVVRDRAAVGDAALRTLTTLLIRLRMQQRDPRLVKVHVDRLWRIAERGTPFETPRAELWGLACQSLRALEHACPSLLAAGAKQLLELSREELLPDPESAVLLAATVLSNASAALLKLPGTEASEEGQQEERGGSLVSECEEEEEEEEEELQLLRRLGLPSGLSCHDPPGPGDTTPNSALDMPGSSAAPTPLFASLQPSQGETSSEPDAEGSSQGAPSSPRCAGAAALDGHAAPMPGGGRPRLAASASACTIYSDEEGTLPPAGAAALLAAGNSLRPFAVPPHLSVPGSCDPPSLYLTRNAQQDMQLAVLEFLAAMPGLTPQGTALLASLLPPILRACALPPSQLGPPVERLLQRGSPPLLAALLRLCDEVEDLVAPWRGRLVEQVLQVVNGTAGVEARALALSWLLKRHHHEQCGAGRPSVLAACWLQLLPAPLDPPELLMLRAKALKACLLAGTAEPEVVLRALAGWEGLRAPAPSQQQLRMATFALRVLATAAEGEGPAALRLHACVAFTAVELAAREPQYLPAVQALLEQSPPPLQMALLRAADGLFAAAAAERADRPAARAQEGSEQTLRTRSSAALSRVASGVSRKVAALAGRSALIGGALQHSFSAQLGRLSMNRSDSNPATPEAPGLLAQCASVGTPSSPSSHHDASAPVSPRQPSTPASPHHSFKDSAYAYSERESPVGAAAARALAGVPAFEARAGMEGWLAAPATWAPPCGPPLRADPMLLRALMLRVVQHPHAQPLGTLTLLESYLRCHPEDARGRALVGKHVGGAVVALCEAAAVTHLLAAPGEPPAAAAPEAEWGPSQLPLVHALQGALGAVEEQSPCKHHRDQSAALLALLDSPAAWGSAPSCQAVLMTLLRSHLVGSVEY